ncbi:MAG: tripartite tricarboxylate transporter substrate binding protein [Treponema sp.]|nr:tripartite tricarboxylate transporter substrate binding protein [Spirochaetia bacterium]MDD6295665.1 tripartite tricarboxylate transporter substrate binding protein [Treponema sp.]MDD7451701.1 tripartite tricarboxylate transporter substrate binding protein [Treponema sp.]MDY2924717.1 tripartite tricarboxylate transporter substrate binding protein [Treponema sp.]MDY5684182.1 tripartite tricarboxylate transporter substrate binding protein [Treponema sp.]
MKRIVGTVLSVALLASAAFAAKPVKYPTKGITVICPWGAGGGTDAVLRGICKAAEKELGKTITVENKTGGSGAIGHAAIKNAKKDGYTLGMITFELNSLPQQGLIDFTYADYDPLIRVNADAATLTVKADAPYNSVKEFVDYCKKNPGKVSIGNSAPGSVWHIGAGLLADKTGIVVKHVPFEGAAGAVTALAGGHIQAVSVSLAEVKSQLDAGNVKVIGIMDEKRPASYPNIKTFKEQGYDITYYTWRGLALPKGVDPAIKKILVDAFTKAEKDPEFVKMAGNMNLNLAYLNSEDFAKFLKTNYEDVTKTMKSLKLID